MSSITQDDADSRAVFQCGSCRRRYTRIDHLARHVRSHTQTKPYQCQVCPKAFGRVDLLKRHVAGHDSPSARSKRRVSPSAETTPGRVTQACRACAAIHVRCTEQKPCHRCAEKGIDCLWDRSVEAAMTPPATIAETTEELSETPSRYLESRGDGPPTASSGVAGPMDVCSELPDLNLLTGQWTPMGTLDFDTSMTFDLNEADLRFLDSYSTNLPFELDTSSPLHLRRDLPLMDASGPHERAAICTEAFRKYYWKFRPNAQDRGGAEEHNLSLPLAAHDHPTPESQVSVPRRITCGRLSVSSRDKILTSMVQSCRSENFTKAVGSFPSVELLDTLLQFYLASPIARSDCFLHAASFDPDTKRPELLAAMVAAGAVLTSDPALSKFGLAIQECLRMAVPKHWERNNALTRDLELLQAYLIGLEIGLWSGHSRKVEIAESFLLPLLTMIRRDGRLKLSGYSTVLLPADGDEAALHSVWMEWVQQESFKRLAFRVLEHDTNVSMALLVNPLISYAEIQLPIPDSADTWNAQSADQWRSSLATANSYQARPLTLADYLGDPEGFNAHKNAVDTRVTNFTFLCCAWRLSREYTQLNSLQRASSQWRRWNTILMSSRHEEIVKLLDSFRVSACPPGLFDEEVTMRLEFNFMHLHMPFEEMQVFAGIDGLEQARLAYPVIHEWVAGDSARRAVWHGGQVLRYASLLPRGAIWGIRAIMVYQAGLALWIYGQFSEDPEFAIESAGSVIGPTAVHIDGPESLAAQRFIQLGAGSPCVQGFQEADSQAQDVYLYWPDRVMATVADILRRNHNDTFRPHLVDNLIQLVEGLQNASTNIGTRP